MNSQTLRASAHQAARTGGVGFARPVTLPVTGSAFDAMVLDLNIRADDARAAETLLSADELERARRFAFDRDRRRYVVARAELRRQLGQRLELSPRSIEFRYGRYGKPALANGFTNCDLRFNVSHCDDVAVFAFAVGRELGVDVEIVRSLADADEVAAHCFSAAELASYRALDAQQKPEGFFNCWTRKEALVKAVGDGLNYPLADFDVSLVPGEPAKILTLGSLPGDSCGWELHALTTLPGLAAAIVIETSRC